MTDKQNRDLDKLLEGAPYPSNETFERISELSGFSATISKSDKKMLREFRREKQAAQEAIMAWTWPAARAEAQRQQAELASDLHAVTKHGHGHESVGRIRTAEDIFENDFLPKLKAAKRHDSELDRKHFEQYKPLADRAVSYFTAFAEKQEDAERVIFSQIAIPYEPSHAVLVIRRAAAVVKLFFATDSGDVEAAISFLRLKIEGED